LGKHQHKQGGITVKKTIVTLVCALIVPLAFAQTSSTAKKHKRHVTTTTTEPITVTGTYIAMEEGAAASYQPARTLVVRTDGSNNPDRYVLQGPGAVVNKRGQVIRTPIKPGTRVHVFYTAVGETRVVDHVVVEE
jgi:hypothetical protein